MINIRFLLAYLLMLGLTPASEAGKSKADTDSLHRFFKEVNSISARFTQVVVDESNQVIQESSGILWIQRPNKFRWDYNLPYKQQIVADGKRIWVYDEGLQQVTVRPLTNSLSDTPAMLLAGKGSLDDNFKINPLDEKDDMEWMRLTPRHKDNGYQSIRIAFVKGNLRVMEMLDGLGHTTRMTFNATKENIKIDPDQFNFTPPPGVDVVGGQEVKSP